MLRRLSESLGPCLGLAGCGGLKRALQGSKGVARPKKSSLPWPRGSFPIPELRWRLALGLDCRSVLSTLESEQSTVVSLVEVLNMLPPTKHLARHNTLNSHTHFFGHVRGVFEKPSSRECWALFPLLLAEAQSSWHCDYEDGFHTAVASHSTLRTGASCYVCRVPGDRGETDT